MSVAPAVAFVPELNELDKFVWATLKGWGVLPARRLLHGSLDPLSRDTDPEAAAEQAAERLRKEEEDAELIEFADDQAGDNYPYLFSLVVVRLWAILEAAVDETMLGALADPLALPDSRQVTALEGPLLEFSQSGEEGRADMLFTLLREGLRGPFPGVARHEALLNSVGLGGPVKEPMRRVLVELAEIRHCTVHRNGRADEKLVSLCPWLGLAVRARIPADLKRFWFHRTAVYWYLTEICRRWAVWKGDEKYLRVTRHMAHVVETEMGEEWPRLHPGDVADEGVAQEAPSDN